MAHYLALAGRPVAVVNLDPAADPPAGEEDAPFAVDVRDLVDLSAVMAAHALGPNGGLLFCVDHLAENVDWLIDAVAPPLFPTRSRPRPWPAPRRPHG